MRRLRSAAIYLALVALVMRAWVPVGWMPDAAAGFRTVLIPCPMMDGRGRMAMLQQKAEPQHPSKHRLPDSHEGSICPFATAARPVRAIEPHQIEVAPTLFSFIAPAALVFKAAWDHVPRAPPAAV